jgi:hypothetical protein
MPKLAADLMVAQAMALELPDYLLGDRLFRQVVVKTPAGTQQPKMTLGGLLSRYQLLQHYASDLDAGQQQLLSAVGTAIDEHRRVYRTQWVSFLQKELKSYLDSWRWYIDECVRRGGCAGTYAGEVWIRTRLALLIDEAAILALATLTEQGHLRRLDSQLRSVWQEGSFLLEDAQRDLYPADRYWWLYGLPVGTDRDR